MRAVPSLLLLVLSVAARVDGQSTPAWSDITFDQSNPITGIWCLTTSTCFIVGPNEIIYRTTNAGSSFSRVSTPIGLDSTKCCSSIRFLSSSVGWIGGSLSVLRSTNGGTSWGGTQIVGSTSTRYSIFGVSDTTAFQVGSLYRYVLSLGGGQVQTSSRSSLRSLRDLHMFDPDNGIGVGPGGAIIVIGAATGETPTFAQVAAPTSSNLNAVWFVDANVGFAVGDGGAILRSNNGGSTWTLQPSGTVNNLRDVWFRDASIGWAVGDAGLILITLNGGQSWVSESSGTSNNLMAIHGNSSNAYAVGANGTILKRAPLSVVVTGVNPDRGPTSGGTAITISGAGFKSGAQVKLGGTNAVNVTFVNSSTITAVTPPHIPGSVDVTVTNTDNTSATLPRGFLYEGQLRRRAARR